MYVYWLFVRYLINIYTKITRIISYDYFMS